MPGRRRLIAIVAALLVVAAVATPLAVRSGRRRANIAADGSRLNAVGMVVLLYAQDHGGAFPETLDAALRSADQNPSFACCAAGGSDSAAADPRLPYVYLGRRLTADTAGPATVVAYSPAAFSGGAGSNVCFGDAHVVWVRAADLPAVLARGGPATRPATLPVVVQSDHG